MGMANQRQRLKRLEGNIEPRQEIVVSLVDGVDDPDEVLNRMVASGEIAEHQRADVRLLIRSFVEPIWEMHPDGSERLVGRRNVHTNEVDKVEWGDPQVGPTGVTRDPRRTLHS
jgi:hypothetical protein